MTDRKGLADRLKVACEHCQRMTTVPTESLAALRQEPSVEEVARAMANAEHAPMTYDQLLPPMQRTWKKRAAQAIASLYRGKP